MTYHQIQKFFGNIMASPAGILPLAILAPAIFMLSNNWFMYSSQELLVSFLTLILVCSFIFATGHFIYSRLGSIISGKLKLLCYFIFCVLFVGVLLIFLELPLRGFFMHEGIFVLENPRMKFAIACILIACFLYFAIIKFEFKPVFKLVKIFLTTWLFLSMGTGLYSLVSTSTSNDKSILDESEHIELVGRPNIYLFILESYYDLNTMRDIYDIDTEPLQSHILSHGFTIYENVYSNSPYTLMSMTDMFGMRLNIAQAIGLHDIPTIGRILIGGGSGNQVYRILKENKYHTAFLAPYPPLYYFYSRGVYLDESNVDFESTSIRPLCESVPRLSRYCYGVGATLLDDGREFENLSPEFRVPPEFRNNLVDNIRMVIDRSKAPLFLGFKSGANHAPFWKYSWKQKDEWVSSGAYRNNVNRGNQEIFEIVDLIADKDPSAVIILIGDHGATRLRHIWKEAEGLAELEQFLGQNGESLDSLAHDIFGTFMAIRMPGKGDISKGLPISHVNLFRHIFAALADNAEADSILRRRAPSESDLGNVDSRLKGIKLVKDGIVQRPTKP